MPLAYIQQQQQGTGLKNNSLFEDESSSRSLESMVAAMAASGASTNGISSQVSW